MYVFYLDFLIVYLHIEYIFKNGQNGQNGQGKNKRKKFGQKKYDF